MKSTVIQNQGSFMVTKSKILSRKMHAR